MVQLMGRVFLFFFFLVGWLVFGHTLWLWELSSQTRD